MVVTMCLLGTFVSCEKSELNEQDEQNEQSDSKISELTAHVFDYSSIGLSWDNPESADFDHIEIYYGEGSIAADATTQFTGTISDNGTVIDKLLSETKYVFLLKTVDTEENKSAGVIITATTKARKNKIEVSNLTAIVRNERIILKWTPPNNPKESLMYPIVYYGEGTTAADATTQYNWGGVYGDTLTIISELTNDTQYVFVVRTLDYPEESKGVMVTATPIEMNEVLNSDLTYHSFTDTRDGEVYKTIQIGNQTWMAENFRYLPSVYSAAQGVGSDDESRYYVQGYEGSDVSAAKTHTMDIFGIDWNGDGMEYQNGTNKMVVNCYQTYGVLYNKPAAIAVCPAGWHLPTDEEWKTLEMYLGMSESDANKDGQDRGDIVKKLAAQIAWSESPLYTNMPETIGYNFYSNNSSGFSALPGGYRQGYYGGFGDLGLAAYWWTATQDASNTVYYRELRDSDISRGSHYRSTGLSVRYIKD